jgi:hypothetical protein
MAEHLPVTVNVPADRLGEFHQMFGRWLTNGTVANASPSAHSGGKLTWDQADVDLAIAFYRGISPRADRILDCWMDATDRVEAETTAAAAGLDGPYGVAGCLSSVGKASARLNVELPFEHFAGDNDKPSSYQMLSAAKPLFIAARNKVGAR